MNQRWADTLEEGGPAPLLALIVAGAALAGMATAVVGSAAGLRTIYYVAVFGFIAVAGLVAVTRAEPLRFVFLALIACFPIAAAAVPPARFGFAVFHVVMLGLLAGLVGKNLFASSRTAAPLFPGISLLIAWLICIPCVAFSQFPLVSLLSFSMCFSIYAFFVFALDELRREGGFERLILLLAVVLIIMAIGFLADHFLGVNLSLHDRSLNQVTYLDGLQVYRARGFFQDPLKAGAYVSCLITFLLVLSVRGRFRGGALRFLVWASIVLGLGALLTTISRAAIIACLSVSALALFAFNKWSLVVKMLALGGMTAGLTVVALMPADLWTNMVPATVSQRFLQLSEEWANRPKIWFDTWDMFADHPLTGIGFSSFRPYLLETRPTMVNYYGIGTTEGIPYIPDNPESGYLKILYEGGILGSIAVLLVAGGAIARAISVIARGHPDSDARTESIAALAGLVAFGMTFVTLFTVSDPRIGAIFSFFLAVVWHRWLQRAQVTQKA
jgi:O-antigen ligase